MRLLEVELRQSLLLRNGRGALPTEAGQLLLEHGRGILHQVERAREELGRVRGALAGRVAIGLPPSLAKVLAVPLVRQFRRQMPEATLSISDGLSLGMQASLASDRLDIALLYNARPSAEIELTALLQEALFLVQRKPPGATRRARNVAVPLREVAGLPLVIPTRPNAIRMQVETEMANQGCRPTIALEIDREAAVAQQTVRGRECASSRDADPEGDAGVDPGHRPDPARSPFDVKRPVAGA